MESALVDAIKLVSTSVISATAKVTTFTSDFNRLNSILFTIKLAIDDIERLNEILDRPKHETEMFTLRLLEGEKLVNKCSKIKWNVFKRWYYSKKLVNFHTSLLSFFQIDVTVHQSQEIKRISVMLSCLEEKTNQMFELMAKCNPTVECRKDNGILIQGEGNEVL